MEPITQDQLTEIMYELREQFTTEDLSKQLKVSLNCIYHWTNQDSFPYPIHLQRIVRLAHRVGIHTQKNNNVHQLSESMLFPS